MDAQRGLIPRSVFLRKILEQAYASNQVNERTIPQIRPQVGPLDESAVSRATGKGGRPKSDG